MHSSLLGVGWLIGWWFSRGDYTAPGGDCEFLRVYGKVGKRIDYPKKAAWMGLKIRSKNF
jgi:hypothetical protein